MTEPKPTETKEDTGFTLVIGESTDASLPAVANNNVPANTSSGGLTYATATPAERTKMDEIMATIDLTNSDSIIELGSQQREKLAKLADDILDSVQPSVRLAFAAALKELIDLVKENSLEDIKKRIQEGGLRRAGKALFNALSGKDNQVEIAKGTIERFMTDISDTRKTIEETIKKLQDQQVELEKNYIRINTLGAAMVEAAQDMRIVRAATSEYIRRVNDGEVTVLSDLQKEAETTQRADVQEKLQLANANWNNLRTVDGDLLASIAVYDMNVANLAFTKQANIQNRLQTKTLLSTAVSEWKSQLAMFATVTTETAAAQMIGAAKQLTEQSIKQGKDLFDTLVDTTIQQSGKGTYNLRQLVDAQGSMSAKLATVGPLVEAQFEQLEKDKKALEQSSVEFRKSAATVYSKKGGILSTPTPAAKRQGPAL